MHDVMLIFHGATPPLPGTDAWDALSEDEQRAVHAEYGALNALPGVTPGVPMGLPDEATTVRVRDGRPVMTDGPFAETEEAVGGARPCRRNVPRPRAHQGPPAAAAAGTTTGRRPDRRPLSEEPA